MDHSSCRADSAGIYKLEEDIAYGKPDRYACDGKVSVPLLGDLEIDLVEVFAE